MNSYRDTVMDTYGNAVPGATVTVNNHLTGLAASIYSDFLGGTLIPNTLTADANGVFSFYAPTGRYDLIVQRNGVVLTTLSDVTIGDTTNIVDLQAKVSLSDLAATTGSSLVGHISSGTGAVARTAQSKLRDTVSVKDFGAVGDGITDDTAAIQAAINSVNSVNLNDGIGGVVRLPEGRFLISSTITIPFGVTLEGIGSNAYGSALYAAASFSGSEVISMTPQSGYSFNNGHIKNIAINCNDVSGVGAIKFNGAYENSSICDIFAYNIAGDAIGIEVTTLTTPGAVNVCESILLRDIYAIHTAVPAIAVSKPVIKLNKCQETSLINVKALNSNTGGTPTAGNSLELVDCRGITIIGGAVMGSSDGISISASTRASIGITLTGVTYENIGNTRIKILGTASYSVSSVVEAMARVEYPNPVNGIDCDYCEFIDVTINNFNAILGANVASMIIRDNGSGTITANASAKYTRLSSASAVKTYYSIYPSLDINSNNTPSSQFTVNGRTGNWAWRWSASSTVDNGFQLKTPGGLFPIQAWEASGATRIGFQGATAIAKPAITGSRGGNAALASLLTALASYGLITDSTTA
ncbi:MAG: glycosyl hydrolase family 28-related protein [Methylobacter sp.]